MLASTSSPRTRPIVVAVSLLLQANPIHQTVMRTHVAICVPFPPSLLQLVSNPLPQSDSCKHCRQSMNQENNMHSFTFLCASLPPVHSQSACPAVTPVYPRGRGYTEVQLPPPFCGVLVTHSVATSHVLFKLHTIPKNEHWLYCWSLRTYHTTHILSYQSVEPVSQHTDTCCEQAHRSSQC